jgi:hypothetical protein
MVESSEGVRFALEPQQQVVAPAETISVFTATCLSSTVSSALQTSPKPPRPSRVTRR